MVRVGPEHPMRFEVEAVSGGLKPYILVRGRLEALVTRALYYDLVELAVTESAGAGADESAGTSERFGIWSGGAFFEMND